jgi:uncharacterized phosphosugar-binding protein
MKVRVFCVTADSASRLEEQINQFLEKQGKTATDVINVVAVAGRQGAGINLAELFYIVYRE